MAQPHRRAAGNPRHAGEAGRTKWPLVAITNGNAQPELFGLSDYFEFVLRAGPHGRAKPFSDMYHLAADRLGVALGEILHVGDDLTTDVAGAIRCGMQACWIKPEGADLMAGLRQPSSAARGNFAVGIPHDADIITNSSV